MSDRSRYRVQKHRALQKARTKEIEEITKIIEARSNNLDNEIYTEQHAQEEDDSAVVTPEQIPEIVSDIQENPPIDNTHQLQPRISKEDSESELQYSEYNNKDSFTEKLRVWAVECNIQQNHLDKLLGILRNELELDLPKSSKTFLGTAEAEYEIMDMKDYDTMNTNGQFVYFGMKKVLEQIINTEFHKKDIELLINIDGMPVTVSGSKSFWPILCKVYHHPDVYKPFTVGIYYGKSKPKSPDEYLDQFINEINDLQQNGLVIEERLYKVKLKAVVCDTPARAYLKCTKGHGGYHACERCTVRGELVRVGRGTTVTYPGANHQKRTKFSFITQEDSEHHTGVSPLLRIRPELDMMKLFVLDHMHLFFNGVMKKLLQLQISGPLKVRLSRLQKNEISLRLLRLKSHVPAEFQRKPRSIFEYLKWKATEFRFFLLYCGPIVLKNVLSSDLYDHFMLLHIACRILCSEKLALTHNSLAKSYLKKFVSALPYLYEPQALVINMHNLLHVIDDVRNMNCPLSRISCFPFENALGKIKRTLRTPNKPLSQLCRRLHEQNVMLQKKAVLPVNRILDQKVNGQNDSIKSIYWNSMIISCKMPDNMVLLNHNVIMEISAMHSENNLLSSIQIEGKIWQRAKLVYSYPCKSRLLKTWQLSSKSQGIAKYPLTCVSQKLVRLPFRKNESFVIPLLH